VPIGRYFVLVGSVLLAVLFLVGWYFPVPPDVPQQEPGTLDKSTIRIQSTYRWPARVVIDTNLPTIIPPPASVAAAAVTADSPATAARDASAREALAQMQLTPAQVKIAQHQARPRPKRRFARVLPGTRVAAYPMMQMWTPSW
jgi:hypothetical protein